jgi:hypothetical protein
MATVTTGNTGASGFETELQAAMAGGYVAHLTGQTYTVTSPIVINVTSTIQGALGIDLGGAKIISQITDGSPVIQINVGPGVDLRYLTLSNFSIQGNGQEGDGIKIVADGNDRWVYNWNISNVNVEHVGGIGLDVIGSVFEGTVSNSWMNGNAGGGARFAHSTGGGQASALRWFGGGFLDNGVAGLILDNGARDMSVEGASFVNNNGAGISAESGITSVSSSDFRDNHGPGVWFQNYANFNNDTFESSGAQTVGITGWLNGNATLFGNTSTYTGTGSAPTVLANLQGNGSVAMAGGGNVITGPNVTMGVAPLNVTVGTQGVPMPALPAVTAATSAATPSSTGTGALETALKAAMAGGYVSHLTGQTYTVTSPIVINVTSTIQGPLGIDLGGAKIISQITDGSPVIQINVGPGVDLRYLTLSNFSIQGNGQEGDGIKIVAGGNDRWVYDWNISNVNVEHVGGIGLDVIGNVFVGTVSNSWMNGNAGGGARFADSVNGGQASALNWFGGGFRNNGVAGLILDNGARDMSVNGAYFVENKGPGIDAVSGITSVRASGFENNQGAGAVFQNYANFTDNTFSTWGLQTVGIGGYLAGQANLIGNGSEYYGTGSDPTVLVNLQGKGALDIVGGGNVVTGPDVTVTGTALVPDNGAAGTALSLTVDPVISAAEVHAVSYTVAGLDVGATGVATFAAGGTTVTANVAANGTFAVNLSGLANGPVMSSLAIKNAAGNTANAVGNVSMLDTTVPVITSNGSGGTASITMVTGQTLVTTVIATDIDPRPLTYAITGGEDQALFHVTNGNQLSFIAAPDLNALPSTGAIPGYQVGVTVTDAHGGFTTQQITVNVSPNPHLSSGAVSYFDAVGGVYVDLPTQLGRRADAGVSYQPGPANVMAVATDHLSGVHNVTGSGFDDLFVGDTGTDFLYGGAGNDLLYSNCSQAAADNAGDTTLDGGTGVNALYGGSAYTIFMAGDANGGFNQVWGGASKMAGVSGYTNNTISFANDGGKGVYVDLGVGHCAYISASGGWTGTGVFEDAIAQLPPSSPLSPAQSSVPNVIGSSVADTIQCDSSTDRITGGGGADALYAGGGRDTFAYTSYGDSNLNTGYDTIVGFKIGTDLIDLSALHVNGTNLAISTNGKSNTLYIEQTPGMFNAATDLALIVNTTTSGGLHASNFVF